MVPKAHLALLCQCFTNRELALALWATGSFEARLLACVVDNLEQATHASNREAAGDFDSWAKCEEWVKRGWRALMAWQSTIKQLMMPILSDCSRLSKRVRSMNEILSKRLSTGRYAPANKAAGGSIGRAARWVAVDALRELKSEKVQKRFSEGRTMDTKIVGFSKN